MEEMCAATRMTLGVLAELHISTSTGDEVERGRIEVAPAGAHSTTFAEELTVSPLKKLNEYTIRA